MAGPARHPRIERQASPPAAPDEDLRMSPAYACIIAASNGLGEATVSAVLAPLTLEGALVLLAQRHVGEVGRVVRLPAALPEPGTLLQGGMSAAPSRSAWQIRGELARQARWRRPAELRQPQPCPGGRRG
jgi:hypothetical protein